MATWHQHKNPSALIELWRGHPTHWSCISDTYGRYASRMVFPDEASARAYAAKTGDVVAPPAATSNR